MKFLPLILIVILAGCATEANFAKAIKTWEGHLIEEYIAQSGQYPAHVQRGAFADIYVFDNSYTGEVPSFTGDGTSYSVRKVCRITMRVSQGRISAINWQGNDCRSL